MSIRFVLPLLIITLCDGCTARNDPSPRAQPSFMFDAGAVFVPPGGAKIEHTFTFLNPSSTAPMKLTWKRPSDHLECRLLRWPCSFP